MLAIRLPQSIEKRLEKLARRTGRTKTFYVREAILEHLDDLEDLYAAERVLQRIRSGEEQTIPLEDALKRHGLESDRPCRAQNSGSSGNIVLVITGSSARSKTNNCSSWFFASATAEKSTGSLPPSRASATKSANNSKFSVT